MPVSVISALSPSHIVAVPLIVAVGNGNTVTVALPVSVCVQLGIPDNSTLTKA